MKLSLKSAPAGSGISFARTDLPHKILLAVRSLAFAPAGGPGRRTTLAMGPLQVQTTEHFLAALSGLGIDNLTAETDSEELPGLDGSAAGFVELLRRAGVVEQDAPKEALKITAPVWVRSGDVLLAALPDDVFRISYTLSYARPALGTQFFSTVITEESFVREIAPARTFCLEEEALELLKRGFGKGANYENTLVIGTGGPLNTKPRFADEPVRHKVLDLIGDLYLVGRPIVGHIVAVKSGHTLNMELVKKLKEGACDGK